MAAAGLRRATTTASGRGFLRLRTRRAEYRELLFHRRTLAFRAADLLSRRKNDVLETMMATATAVFVNRHKSSLGSNSTQQAEFVEG